MAGTLGTITGQVRIDVKQAIAAYAALRAANIATLLALRSASATFIAAGAAIGGIGLVITAGFAKAIKSAADFERQLDFFGAVSNSTEAQMEAVRVKALQLGKDTIFSAGQIADSFVELGKAGISAEQIIGGVGDAVASLGAAADIPLATAANIITSAVQTFELSAKDAVHVADLLAGAANASIVEVVDLGVSLKYVGGVAAAISIPIEDVISAISLLGKAGIRGSTAGTSLRQILVSLTGTSKKAHAQLKELGIVTESGANLFFTAAGKAKPLADIFQILQDHTKNLTEAQRLAAFKIIFNNRALAAANILARDGAAGFAKMNAEIGKTTAADVAHKRLDNLSGDIEILRGNIETLLIQAGTPFQGFLRTVVQNLTKLVGAFGKLSPGMQNTIIYTTAIAGALFVLIGAISITIGMIFKMGANLLLLKGAITTVLKILSALRISFIATWLAALGPVGLVIAIVLAVIAALVLLYVKVEAVRKVINFLGKAIASGLVTAFKAVIKFFQTLPGFFAGVWGAVVNAFNTAKAAVISGWNAVIAFFVGLGTTVKNAVVTGFNAVVAFFAALPGRILGFVSALVTGIVTFFMQLPERVGFALGFMVGRAIAIQLMFMQKMLAITLQIVTGVASFLAQLPGRVASIIINLATRAVSLFVAWQRRMAAIAVAVVNAVGAFLAALPGRIASIVSSAASRALSIFVSWQRTMGQTAVRAATAVINGITSLPGRLAALFRTVVSGAVSAFNTIIPKLGAVARAIPGAITGALSGLGGLLKSMVLSAISGLGNLAGAAASEAQKVGGAIWSGFKKGLGIHSPSFLEKAMFAIHDTMLDELKFLDRTTRQIQQFGGTIPKVQETIGATQAAQAVQINRVVVDGAPTQPRRPGGPPVAAASSEGAPLRFVKGELSIDASGRAFIRGVAEEVYDDNEAYEASLGRMG